MSDNIFAFAQARATLRAELTESWLVGGTLKVYSTPRPATSDTAIASQTLLATFIFGDPAGTVANGVWTAETIEPAMVAVSGTAVFARAYDSTGVAIADADVGAPSSEAMIELSAINLVGGAFVSVLSFTLTEN
jgi:hypothetical protein